MKKTVIAAALLCLAAGFSLPVSASDPCEVVLCLYGKVTGSSGSSECRGAEKSFFSLNAFKKKGQFDPTKTATLRNALLGECQTADPAAVANIISQFGRIRGG